MYQLYKLLGEDRINKALKNFYNRHAYPALPPVSLDLLQELYAVASPKEVTRIDELFRQIVTYDVLLDSAVQKRVSSQSTSGINNKYEITVNARINKYSEDGKGKSITVPFNDSVTVAVYGKQNELARWILPVVNGRVQAVRQVNAPVVDVVLDPDGLLLNRVEETKRKRIVEQ